MSRPAAEDDDYHAPPVVLTFSNLCVAVENAKPSKDDLILRNVSAVLTPGLCAVMGPTASGKSSLLNALVGHLPVGLCVRSGDVCVNGKSFTPQQLHFGHCLQVDELNGRLTVMETLMYAAELTLFKLTPAERLARVEGILKDLQIFHVKDVLVGTPQLKGISGGQRKRVSIGMCLLTRPPILLLDEPTAGLDSVTAMHLLEMLKDMSSNRGVLVLCVIHQPQRAIFNLLDRLILLRSGEIVYNGQAADCIPYMEGLGYKYDGVSNPADHIMEVISPELGETMEHLEQRCLLKKNYKAPEVDLTLNSNEPLPVPDEMSSRLNQFRTLLRRQALQELRDTNLHLLNFGAAVSCALLIGAVYFRLPNTSAGLSRRNSALFFLVINQSLFGAMKSILSFPEQRKMMLRERKAKLYSTSPAFLAWNIVDFLQIIVWSSVFSVVSYFMIGLRSDSAGPFFLFWFFLLLDKLAASTIATLICSLTSRQSVPTALLPAALEISRLFGGFFLPPSLLPDYFVWLDALSYVKYVYTGVVQSQFVGADLSDSTTAADLFITSRKLNFISIGGCVGALIAMIIGMKAITYLFMLKVKH
jgi:ABC-type multidrug transport system ATPase subunit/ABC-type multidrug transport system permease subunit